MCAGQQL